MDARTWLKENGYRVKPKGRIPADLLAIYQAKEKRDATRRARSGSSGPDHLDDGDSLDRKKRKPKRSSCGFCTVNAAHKHKHCPGTINQGKMGIWTCLCYEKDHTL